MGNVMNLRVKNEQLFFFKLGKEALMFVLGCFFVTKKIWKTCLNFALRILISKVLQGNTFTEYQTVAPED